MITILSLNPALDRLIKINEFVPECLNKVEDIKVYPGGKGINVTRILHQLGCEVAVIGFAGGDNGKKIDKVLDDEGITRNFAWIESDTRENIKIFNLATGKETEINQAGKADKKDMELLQKSFKNMLKDTEVLVLAGSLPDGLPVDTYNTFIKFARYRNIPTILDTSGEYLRYGLKNKPYLVKPNLPEVEEITGLKITSIKDLEKAVDFFRDKGIEFVTISLGEEGAVFANQNKSVWVKSTMDVKPVNTIGAGDAMVAALAAGLEEKLEFEEMAEMATVVATLFVMSERGSELKEDHLEEVIKSLEIVQIF